MNEISLSELKPCSSCQSKSCTRPPTRLLNCFFFWIHCVLKQQIWEALYKTSTDDWKNWALDSNLRTYRSWWQWEDWFWNTKTAMTSIDRKALYYIHTTVLHSNKQRIAEYTYRAPESTFGTVITQEGKLAPY